MKKNIRPYTELQSLEMQKNTTNKTWEKFLDKAKNGDLDLEGVCMAMSQCDVIDRNIMEYSHKTHENKCNENYYKINRHGGFNINPFTGDKEYPPTTFKNYLIDLT